MPLTGCHHIEPRPREIPCIQAAASARQQNQVSGRGWPGKGLTRKGADNGPENQGLLMYMMDRYTCPNFEQRDCPPFRRCHMHTSSILRTKTIAMTLPDNQSARALPNRALPCCQSDRITSVFHKDSTTPTSLSIEKSHQSQRQSSTIQRPRQLREFAYVGPHPTTAS